MHARAPAGTCAGEGAGPGRAGARGPGAGSLARVWAGKAAEAPVVVSANTGLLRPAGHFTRQQGAVQAHGVLTFIPVARSCARRFLHSQVK